MKNMLRLVVALAVVLAIDVSPWLPPLPVPTAAAQAVNQVIPVPAAAGTGPSLAATGPDTNIDITLTPKGSGALNLFGAGAATTVGPYASPGPRSGTSSNIVKKLLVQSLSIIPASSAFAGLCTACLGYFSTTVIVPGLALTDSVFIDSGNIAANVPCKPVTARVSAASSLLVWFAKQTTIACTPSPGIFHILVVGT